MSLSNGHYILGNFTNSTTGLVIASGNTNTLGGVVTNPAGGQFRVTNGAKLTFLGTGSYSNAGTKGGRTTLATICARLAPSSAAASSSSRSKSRKTGSTVRTTKGKPTKTSATRMPARVKAKRRVTTSMRSRHQPRSPSPSPPMPKVLRTRRY